MPNIRLVIEYCGASFNGWQIQDGQPTVQSELKKAIETVLRVEIGPLIGAGRTDSGVHARGQVVNFYVDTIPDLEKLALSVSSLLRGRLAILNCEVVPDSFNARNDAKSKQYSYRILCRNVPEAIDAGRVWRVNPGLNLDLMMAEAQKFVGEHDFSSFRASGCVAKSPVRKIFESEITFDLPYVTYRVIGNGFLRHMVRIITGTLVGIGKGNLEIRDIQEIIKLRDRSAAGVTAPPDGLTMDWVDYGEKSYHK